MTTYTTRIKRLLLAVLAAACAFVGLSAWAVASPVGSSPDDDYHLVSIWCALGDRDGLCAPGEHADERTVATLLKRAASCYAFQPEQSAGCIVDDGKTLSTTRGNFDGNYPPLFYATMSVFASQNIPAATVTMRLVNIGIFIAAVAAVLALLQRGQRGPIIWTAVVALVPLGVFLIASVNPSSWAILAGLLVWAAGTGYFTATTRTRRCLLGAITGLITVMGAGARGDSAAFVALSLCVAMALTFRRERSWFTLAALPLTLIVTAAGFFLTAQQATGFSRAALAQNTVVPNPTATGSVVSSPGLLDLLANLVGLPWLLAGGTGTTWGLGWHDSPMPDVVGVLMVSALGAIIFWGIRHMTHRKALVLAVVFVAMTTLPLYVLHSKGLRVGDWVQPRYLLPVLILFVAVSLTGIAHDHLGISRLQAASLFAFVALANALALHAHLRRYTVGHTREQLNLNRNIEWWWPTTITPMAVWIIGSMAFALLLFGLWCWFYPIAIPRPARSSLVPPSQTRQS